MNEHYVINLGRQLGSGGKEIGEKLAEALNIAFYDKELIKLASDESGLCKEFFEKADERAQQTLLGGLLAENQSCLFVGRCADYILRDHPRHVNIFISASKEARIERLMNLHGISERQAEEMIEKADKKRSSYYNYYSNKTWGEAATYHLCMDSSVLGIDKTVEYILQFVKHKLGI